MEMKGVIADSPCYCTLFTGSRGLIGLAFNAKIHDVVSADGAVVDYYIPSPKSDGIPLFDLELLSDCDSIGLLGSAGSVLHFDVGHVQY